MASTSDLPPAEWYREDSGSVSGNIMLISTTSPWTFVSDPHVSLHEITPIFEVSARDILNDPENIKYDRSLFDRSPDELSALARFWTTRGTPHSNFQFLVAAQGKTIGIAGYAWIGRKDPHPSNFYWSGLMGSASVMINPKERRKGYGFKALKTVIDYGLRNLGLEVVVMYATSLNTATIRMMEDKFGVPTQECGPDEYFGNNLKWTFSKDSWHGWLRNDALKRYQAATQIIAQQTYGQTQGQTYGSEGYGGQGYGGPEYGGHS